MENTKEKENRRIIFTFDEVSYANLVTLGAAFHFNSMAETVRAALRLVNTFKNQFENGFTEIIVRNPNTGAERILVGDFLERLDKAAVSR